MLIVSLVACTGTAASAATAVVAAIATGTLIRVGQSQPWELDIPLVASYASAPHSTRPSRMIGCFLWRHLTDDSEKIVRK